MKGNKLERSVQELSKEMGGIDIETGKWLLSTLTPSAYVNKNKVTCLECGHEFTSEFCNIDGTIDCPICGKHLKLIQSRKKHYDEGQFSAVTNEYKGWQVLRFFWVNKYRGLNRMYQSVEEVEQIWFNEASKIYLAKPLVMYPNRVRNPFRLGFWNGKTWVDNELLIRRPSKDYYCGFDCSKLGYKALKVISVASFLKYRGVTRRISAYPLGVQFDEFAYALVQPLAEVMYKSKQTKLLASLSSCNFWKRDRNFSKRIMALKIALRHKYFLTHKFKTSHGNSYRQEQTYRDWYDTIEQVIDLELDYRSPKYVCPDDLLQLHQTLNKRVTREREKREKLDKLKSERQRNESYIKARERFFGINLVDEKNDFSIQVLKSVDDFFKEGNEMNHCVFNNSYYNIDAHPHSLILSARKGIDWNKSKDIIETVEVNLKDMMIAQSRGHNNQITELHGKIIKLVMEHMDEIEECNKKKSKLKDKQVA